MIRRFNHQSAIIGTLAAVHNVFPYLIFGYYLCPLHGLIQRGKSVVYDNNSSIIVAIIGETENATG